MPSFIQVIVADPDLRSYIGSCLIGLSGVALTNQDPELIVTDRTDSAADGVPRVYVLEEPRPGTLDFVLMPFDSRGLTIAIERALARRRTS